MIHLRCCVAASSLLVMACSSASSSVRSSPKVVSTVPRDVLAHVDLSAFARMEGRIDDALHTATAVVLGLRRIEDACGTYVDLRVDREERYVRGKRHGTCLEYHRPQQLRRKEEYRDDQLIGVIEWHEDGKVAEKLNFENGRRNGLA